MIKRTSILLTAFLFFASTTGLPLVMHYCEMMGTASLEVCEMHKETDIKISCCNEANLADIYFTKTDDPCCSDRLIDSSLKDNFITSKTELASKIHLQVVSLIDLNIDLTGFSTSNFYADTSPPLLIDNHIYLTNSTLLI